MLLYPYHANDRFKIVLIPQLIKALNEFVAPIEKIERIKEKFFKDLMYFQKYRRRCLYDIILNETFLTHLCCPVVMSNFVDLC